ncbi:uncharacterized protein LOC133785469 [Humulus lupulus]|uniref:uncharacterized protein LOC133785469 n=1 Tax=Humulus lupulus TaxID=3486 RepID=UPI002B400A79|nr:uncharacterized protein LOC133785469 [Humulus lupulus]XP_062080690.1 uncharacterized protein LOC133785469 [Humulus lupulus]
MEIQHFRHGMHPLVLKDGKNTIINESIKCDICDRSIIASAPFYSCDTCQYYLHKSCAQLPQKIIHHSFHPSHPLTLSIHEYRFCHSCNTYFTNSPMYLCTDCDLSLHLECAKLVPITHSTHHHPMSLLINEDNKYAADCFGCRSMINSSDRAYGCTECKCFIHESCAESPKQIQYPFHLDHDPLSLHMQYFGFECTVCKKSFDTCFSYNCGKCSFQLCLKCSATKTSASIRFGNHPHLLCYLDNIIPINNQCSINDCYGKRPDVSQSKELSRTSSCVTYCLECNFRAHLLCGPLPFTIKYEFHIHPLILVDLIAEDDSEDYYCDICEAQRDPRIRVYYCEPCKFIAHIHCLTNEIIKTLTGDLKDVELNNLGEDIWKLMMRKGNVEFVDIVEEEQGKSPITLKDLLQMDKALKSYYKWNEAPSELKGHSEEKVDTKDIDWIVQLSRFTTKNFDEFWNDLFEFYRNTTMELESGDLGLKIVTVKGHKIPFTLALVLNILLDKYGDVGSHSTKSESRRHIAYFILCKVLKEMCSILVGAITKEHLQKWYYHLTFVQRNGFRINFAITHLKKLVRSFLGNQAKRLEAEIPTIIKKRMAELKQEIKKEELRLEKSEEYNNKSLPKSEFMEDCLNLASTSKWKSACKDLLF